MARKSWGAVLLGGGSGAGEEGRGGSGMRCGKKSVLEAKPVQTGFTGPRGEPSRT